MPVLRLFFAGVVALFAMVAVMCTAAVVLFTGFMGWLVQRFGGKPAPRRRPQAGNRRSPLNTGDVIDVEATHVPDDAGGR
jgi:uncharacterized iron-regulated membrane protein